MGSIFSKPKPPPPPRIEAPPAIPTGDEGEADKAPRKRKGLATTILTGDLVPQTTGQTLLGGR